METSRSPWKVLRDAYEFALKVWPNLYSSPWSRHDFTLPQLFACLVVREQLGLSYRKTEALLRDAPHWLAMIGVPRAPDHNTLWRAFGVVAETRRVNRMLDLMAEAFAREGLLRVLDAIRPLTAAASRVILSRRVRSGRELFAFWRVWGAGGDRRGRRRTG